MLSACISSCSRKSQVCVTQQLAAAAAVKMLASLEQAKGICQQQHTVINAALAAVSHFGFVPEPDGKLLAYAVPYSLGCFVQPLCNN